MASFVNEHFSELDTIIKNTANRFAYKIRGMDIIFVTTAKTDEEAKELLTLMGAPFTRS